MTDQFHALCAELIDALDSGIPAGRIRMSPLVDRARALLAQPEVAWEPMPLPGDAEGLAEVFWAEPEAEGPTTTELMSLSAACNSPSVFARAVLARWGRPAAQPVAEGPTDQELLHLYQVATPCYSVEEYKRELDFARAVLARWGRPAAEPVPEPTDEALANFTAWFCRNYPGPDTLIHRPEWHAPKVFRAAADAIARFGRPTPQPPADGEVAELVEWLQSMRDLAGEHNPDEQRRYTRAAELLEHPTPQPVAVAPLDKLDP